MTVIVNFGCESTLYESIAKQLGVRTETVEVRNFPDGESYIRALFDCTDEHVIILGGLDQPNSKVLPLILMAETLRDLGATKVGLITPYLAYMRQDIRFKDGEGITSRYFASLMSAYLDWMVTVDPHLHRYDDLSEIYTIPTRVAPAASVLAERIQAHVKRPLLIGPDSESEQWVAKVASLADAPFLILTKTRTGDRDVQISIPEVEQYGGHVPVLIDDIVSTGQTFIETIRHLKKLGMPDPVCMAVHGVFAEHALKGLRDAGAADVVTCNTITHPSNAMDVSGILAESTKELLDAQ